MFYDSQRNLKIWHGYTKTLDSNEVEIAENYLIGAMSNVVSQDDLEKCIQTVDALIKERRDQIER